MEEFRIIKDIPNYEVSSYGRIRNRKTKYFINNSLFIITN